MADKLPKKLHSSLRMNINDLSDDILLQILTRLSCKSAIRCQIVSKRWLKIISSPNFLPQFLSLRLGNLQDQNHLYQQFCFSLNPFCYSFAIMIAPKELASELEPWKKAFSLSFLNAHKVQIEGYSNGLLLCTKREFDCTVYYICNFLTKKWIQLPPAPITRSRNSCKGFVCDPYYNMEEEKATLNSHRRFQVLLISPFSDTMFEFKVNVFSSETGQWSELDVSCPKGFSCSCFRPRITNHEGRLHLLGMNSTLVYDPYNNTGKCHTIDHPTSDAFLGWLGVSSGSLRLCLFPPAASMDNPSSTVVIWKLEGYNGEMGKGKWCSKREVHLPLGIWEEFGMPSPIWGCSDVSVDRLAMHPHDGDVIYFEHAERIFTCNLQTKKLTTIKENDINPLLLMALPWWPTPIPSIIGKCL